MVCFISCGIFLLGRGEAPTDCRQRGSGSVYTGSASPEGFGAIGY